MPLTETAVLQAKPGVTPAGLATGKPYRIFDGRGLFLEVTPTGRKWWRFKYRFAGKENLLSMGVYPDVSLDEARERRDQARAFVAEGIDPSEVRKADRAAQRDEEARLLAAMRFTLDSDGALSFLLGKRRLALSPAETAELRAFLDATRGVTPKVTSCP